MNAEVKHPIPLGTETEYGTVQAIGRIEGERYYWMVDEHGTVSMIPDFMVEV